MGVEVAVAGLIISAAGTAASMVNADKQKKVQKEAGAVNRASQTIQDVEQRRQAVREQRVRVAQIEQSSINTGTGGSSGEVGGISALSTNFAASGASASGQKATTDNLSGLNDKIAEIGANTQRWQAGSQLGSSLFSTSMQNKDTKKSFNKLFD